MRKMTQNERYVIRERISGGKKVSNKTVLKLLNSLEDLMDKYDDLSGSYKYAENTIKNSVGNNKYDDLLVRKNKLEAENNALKKELSHSTPIYPSNLCKTVVLKLYVDEHGILNGSMAMNNEIKGNK